MSDNEKLDTLEDKIKAAKQSSTIDPPKAKPGQKGNNDNANMSVGMRAGMEFVVSIVISVFIGLWLDKTFETKPFFFIALFFLGVITGFVNVWRVTQGVGSAVGYKNLYDDKAADNDAENDEDTAK